MIGKASQNLIRHANKFGPKHFQNVRNSLQLAFNTSSMSPPKQIETLSPEAALDTLARTTKEAELMYAVKDGQITLSVGKEDPNTEDYSNFTKNSPHGAWLNLYFPISKDARLRHQY